MPDTSLSIAAEGDAEPAASIVVIRDDDTYRLSILASDPGGAGGVRLAFAAALSRSQVSALSGMLETLMLSADQHAVAMT